MNRKTHARFVKEMDEINPYIAFDSEYEGARNPIHYTCLRCGYKGVTTPSSLLRGHGCRKCMGINAHDRFSCPHCSPTCSYPERVLMSVLSNAGVFFIHDSTMPWSQGKRYDFIIENCIICETHGIQHYDTDNPFSYTHKDSSIEENDRFKMQLAYSNGFDHYVVIDCKVSNFEYIKNNILKSDLPKLICLGGVDWDICKMDCQSYRDVNIANAYNSGQKVGEIARQMNISKDAIRRALHKASGAGFCNYDSQLELHNSWFECESSVHDCAT